MLKIPSLDCTDTSGSVIKHRSNFPFNFILKLSTLTTRTGRAHVTLKWEEGEWPCVDGYDIQMNVNATGDAVEDAFDFSQVGKMTVATAKGLKSCTAYEVRRRKLSSTLSFIHLSLNR